MSFSYSSSFQNIFHKKYDFEICISLSFSLSTSNVKETVKWFSKTIYKFYISGQQRMIFFKHLQIGCALIFAILCFLDSQLIFYMQMEELIHFLSISSLKWRAVLSFTATNFYPEVNGSHHSPFNTSWSPNSCWIKLWKNANLQKCAFEGLH